MFLRQLRRTDSPTRSLVLPPQSEVRLPSRHICRRPHFKIVDHIRVQDNGLVAVDEADVVDEQISFLCFVFPSGVNWAFGLRLTWVFDLRLMVTLVLVLVASLVLGMIMLASLA